MLSTMDFPWLMPLGMDFDAVDWIAHSIESFPIPIQYFLLDHVAIVMICKIWKIIQN